MKIGFLKNLGVRFLFVLVTASWSVFGQPTFSKQFVPDTIGPGCVSTLTFTIANPSGVPVTDLAFTDILPAGLTIADPSSAFSSCLGSVGTLSAPSGGTTISLSGGSVGGTGTCVVVVDVTSATIGTHMNLSGDLTSSAGNSGSAADDLVVATDRPGFTKSFATNPANLGDRNTLTFVIDNTANPSLAANLMFTDTLPNGLEVASPANVVTTCTGGEIVAVPGTGVISYGLGGFVAAGSSCTIDVDVIATGVGLLGNSAGPLSSVVGPTLRVSGKANATLEVGLDPLDLSKSFIDDPVPPGGLATLEFTITNFDRSDAATDLAFADDLGAMMAGLAAVGLPMNDVCGAGSTLSGSNVLSLTGGNLPPEGTCTFSVSLQTPAGVGPGAYPNVTSTITGTVGGVPMVGSPANDSLFVSVAPLLTKEFIDDPVGAGGDVTLRFTITSTSPTSAATNIAFIDELTTFLPFPVSAVLPATPCGAGSSISLIGLGVDQQGLSLVNGNLGVAPDSCSFDVTLTIPPGMPGGLHTNTTDEIVGTIDGQTFVGSTATDMLEVLPAPTLRKEFTDDPVDPGGTVTLEFTLSHDEFAPGDATGIAFTDDFNATLAGLSAVGLPMNDVCGAGSQISGTTNLSFTGGSLGPGETCTFGVTLQVPMVASPGNHTNTTSNVTATVSGEPTIGLPASDELAITALRFSKEFTDDPVIGGESATLRFTIENLSPVDDYTGIFFNDNLNAALSGLQTTGLSLNDICGAGSSITGTTILIFANGSLNAGESCTFDVTVQTPVGAASGTYVNTTSNLSGSTGGGSYVFDPATDPLIIDPNLLVLTKEFTDDPVAPGGTVTLEFNLTNLDAGSAADSITFTDDLGAALAGLAATGLPLNDICGAGSQISGTDVLTVTGANLPAGGSCSFSVPVQVPVAAPPGPAVNVTSGVTGTIGGLGVTGDPAQDTLTVQNLVQAFSFSKAFDGPTVPGGTPVLTFTIENVGTQSGNLLAFSDDLDAALLGLVATGLPQNDVCGPGSVLSGTSLLTLSGASLAPSETCVINVSLQVPLGATPATYLNTTSDLLDGGLPVQGPAIASLAVEPPPTFDKSFAPAVIPFGGVSTMSFSIDNTGSGLAATNLDFTDNLPAGMVIANPANASTTCTGGTLTALPGSALLTYSGGSVAAGNNCTVQADVLSTTSGINDNVTGDLTSSSGNSGPASARLDVGLPVPPGFSKAFAPGSIAYGGTSTLTFTIDNTGSLADATALDFTDNLPAGVTVATPANASTTCTGGTLTAVAGTTTISYTGGSLTAGATCSVQVDTASLTAGTHVNASGALTSNLGDSGTATDTLDVAAAVPPAFDKVFAPGSIPFGGSSTLTFSIDNTGSLVDATALDFTDNLPAGVTVATPANASTTCTGGTLTAVAGTTTISYTGGSLTAGATCSVQVDTTSLTAGTHVNTSGALTSALGNSGTATDTLDVAASVPPTFSKVFAPDSIAYGGTSTLTFSIDNTGSLADATALDFTDNLPAGVTVATPANASTTCTGGTLTAVAGTTTIGYTGGSLTSGATCTVQVDTTSAVAGTHVNTTGPLTSSLGDSGTASDTLDVAAPIPPVFSKAFDPDLVQNGDTTTVVFTIDNTASLADATNLGFVDILPTGLFVADPANANHSCAGGVITAVPGSDTITFDGGSVLAGSTCTIQVDVICQTQGTVTNTTEELTSNLGSSGTATAPLSIVVAIPTLSKTALVVMVFLLGLGAMVYGRTRRKRNL